MGIIVNSDLDSQIKQLKEQKNSIVFTNGCFDLLHKGHINLLNKELIIQPVKRLRGQEKFENFEILSNQIALDANQARLLLSDK